MAKVLFDNFVFEHFNYARVRAIFKNISIPG